MNPHIDHEARMKLIALAEVWREHAAVDRTLADKASDETVIAIHNSSAGTAERCADQLEDLIAQIAIEGEQT